MRQQSFDDELLAGQIPEYVEPQEEYQQRQPVQSGEEEDYLDVETDISAPVNRQDASQYLGQTLGYKQANNERKEADKNFAEERGLSRIGEKISDRKREREEAGGYAQFMDGWIDVSRELLGDRSKFYPESWEFRIHPATVEAIRNWSIINDENPNSVDDVFNEILKSCLKVMTPEGPMPWHCINSWDRFFFILLIREYSMVNGESKIEYSEECPNCDIPVTFRLTSTALRYDLPDEEVMDYFDQETRSWYIDPAEFDVEDQEPIRLYVPTIERDANIKAWLIDRIRNNKKYDNVFLKFISWMAPKISKELSIAQNQIKKYEKQFKSWDSEMFSFMDDVLKNIVVTPDTKLMVKCPSCGEEVYSTIQFQDGVRSLFAMENKHKKFGKK